MNSLGLYLHVPFCKQKCAYCDFYSRSDLSLVAPYCDALCRSLSAFPTSFERTVDTVYFGGGTPSLFSPEQIAQVFSALHSRYRIEEGAEITMEMNPESATEPVLNAAARAGVNRISFGMQSALPAELERIGRIHSLTHVQKAVALARSVGIDNINLDLMYGLPDQTLASFSHSLKEALCLLPEHISFYALTLSSDVPLAKAGVSLPTDEEVRAMYLYACRFLEENGYRQYEISNAARKGFACRHNRHTWQCREYLGFGPGAHSFFQGRRFSFPCDLQGFIASDHFEGLIQVHEEITPFQRLEEYILLSLRLVDGIDLATVEDLGGRKMRENIEEKFRRYCSFGLALPTDAGYRLTPEGFFVSNAILCELI